MATVKEKKVKKEVVVEEAPVSGKTINDLVREFVGEVNSLHKIDIHPMKNDSEYRVNVWTRWFQPDRVVPTNRISKSYYLKIENGVIQDLTLTK